MCIWDTSSRGALPLQRATHLPWGDRIGHAGNAGNTGEPHLHIDAQYLGTLSEPLSGDPLPMRFDGRFLVRNDRVVAP